MTATPPASPTSSPRARRTRARAAVPVAALAVATFAVAGCGSDDGTTTNAAAAGGTVPRAALADDVPAKAAAFAEAAVRPGGDAKAAIDQVVGLIGGDGGGALAKRLELGDDLLPEGRTIQRDVLPHLGDHVAAFLLGGDAPKAGARTAARSADGAIVAEVRDAAALRRVAGTRGRSVDVDGQTLRIRGDHAVWIGDRIAAIGSEPAVRATIASAGGADLAGNARFTGALAQVRATSPVGVAWLDLQQAPALNAAFRSLSSRVGKVAGSPKSRSSALEALPEALRDRVQRGLGAAKRSGSTRDGFGVTLPATDATAAMALEIAPGRLVVRSGGTGAAAVRDPKPATDAVAALPAGSWAAFAGSAPGTTGGAAAGGLDRLTALLGAELPAGLREALASVTSVSGGVQGQNLLAATGAIVVRTDDDAAAEALLKQLRSAFSGPPKGGRSALPLGLGGLTAKPTTIPGASSGLVAGLPGLPLELAAGVQGNRLAVGLGADSITKALSENGKRFGSDPLCVRAKEALDGAEPSLVLQPKPLADLLASLGDGLGGLLGGTGGSGGLGGLLGGAGGDAGASGRRSATPEGLGAILGSGGLSRVLGAMGRVKLVTAAREKTGATTWRGSLVVEYDGASAKRKSTP